MEVDFSAQVCPLDIQGFIDLMVPLDEKHFSDDEILQLIKFYESPMGQKIARELAEKPKAKN